MALNGGGFLAFAFLGRFFVKLAAAKLSQNSRFLTGTLEATQGCVEILVFFNANTRHTINYSLAQIQINPALWPGRTSYNIATIGRMQSFRQEFAGFRLSLRYDAPPMLVLGLETSCDETGVALYDTRRGLVAQALHSQVALHAEYGGVVPEIASRDHVRRLLPLIQEVLGEANISRPDAIAYTAGPGLVGALMVAGGMANGLGLSWGCPVIPIHHMEGHLLAPMLEDSAPDFPFLALLVSGGHTMLVSVDALGVYRVLGSTLDDAVGEAFDKTAKLLGLSYPGGPALAKIAEHGDPDAYQFPRPMLKRQGFDFSFSGLKTAVMLEVRKATNLQAVRNDIAASFQKAAIDTLVGRTLQAATAENATRVVVAGGVGANKLLREDLRVRFPGQVFFPRPEFCTDNGAMIAFAGAMRLNCGVEPGTIHAQARWSLESLHAP